MPLVYYTTLAATNVFSFTISMDQVFGYADDIVNAMMPVVYVAAGIALGFVVVGKIISAFR